MMNFLTQLLTEIFPPKSFDAKTECCFLRDYSERNLRQRQTAIIIALCTCLAYLGMDIVAALNNESFRAIAISRIFPLRLTGIVALLISTGFLFHPKARNNEQTVCISVYFSALLIYFSLLGLTYLIPFPDEYFYYYDGMLLTLLFIFGCSKLLAKPVIFLVIILLLASWFTFNEPGNSLVLSNFEKTTVKEHDSPMGFLIIFSIIGCFVSISQEHISRNTFIREMELKHSLEKSENKLRVLSDVEESSQPQTE